MKEININIEGYNVNGICVGCLSYNRKMFYHKDVKKFYKLLANIDIPSELSIQLCWECVANISQMNRFTEQILASYELLIEYSKQNKFLYSPHDLSQYATPRLSTYLIDQVSIAVNNKQEDNDDDMKVEVKVEENSIEELPEELPLKDEPEFVDDTNYSEDFPPENDATSDDDIQLSKLKKKKEKREKKIKKEKRKSLDKSTPKIKKEERLTRKMKNLPEDVVKLYIMSEAEMWHVRAKDVESKEFLRLKYKCEDCLIVFNTEKLMTDHLNGKHKQKHPESLQCDVCKAYFLTKDNLSSHRALHLTAYKCSYCDMKTCIKKVMFEHIQTHSKQREYLCNKCNHSFDTKSKFTYHRSVCNQDKPQCDCCGKVFANKLTLKYHLKVPTNKDDKPKEKLYIPCKGCNKVFQSKKSYRSHAVIHNGLTYPCPICGKLFQWKRNLARHTRNHRDKEAGALHECRECNKSFSSRDCYNNHMKFSRRHVAENAYIHECSYCGKKFPTKWCMVDHIDWDHLKRIKYQCSICFKPFKTAKIMVAHVNNIHEGKKNKEPDGHHLCEICGKAYKTVKRLKGHVWAMHTNRSTAKSFKCKFCPATFTWQTSIYKHVKMMHDVTNKRSKLNRPVPPVKKTEPYPDVELANRMQYFQQNIANNIVQNIVQNVQPNTIGIVQNIV